MTTMLRVADVLFIPFMRAVYGGRIEGIGFEGYSKG